VIVLYFFAKKQEGSPSSHFMTFGTPSFFLSEKKNCIDKISKALYSCHTTLNMMSYHKGGNYEQGKNLLRRGL
ncbi:MAG: hypothetical protein K2N34_02620, partial [Lachnospiraceae bacterium]|nr:hypothetical protein [Lachnospiraceae bacterium]